MFFSSAGVTNMSDEGGGGGGIIGTLAVIGIIVLVNVLSYVFNWGFCIY